MSTRPATPREPHAGRPRLQDVAARAGVSAMTVVRVLREPAKVAHVIEILIGAILVYYWPPLASFRDWLRDEIDASLNDLHPPAKARKARKPA